MSTMAENTNNTTTIPTTTTPIVETPATSPPPPPQPVAFKQPSGELRENVNWADTRQADIPKHTDK